MLLQKCKQQFSYGASVLVGYFASGCSILKNIAQDALNLEVFGSCHGVLLQALSKRIEEMFSHILTS